MHGMIVEASQRQRLVEGALRYAQSERSDPYAFNRAMSDINRGLCNGYDKNGKSFGYDAEERKEQVSIEFQGKVVTFNQTVWANRQRP